MATSLVSGEVCPSVTESTRELPEAPEGRGSTENARGISLLYRALRRCAPNAGHIEWRGIRAPRPERRGETRVRVFRVRLPPTLYRHGRERSVRGPAMFARPRACPLAMRWKWNEPGPASQADERAT